MEQFNFKPLTLDTCDRIKEIDASQYIERAWREVDGERQLVDINYHDSDFPEGYEEHVKALKETIQNEGFALGAFNEAGKMVGFVTLNREVFGERFKYVLLDQIFISKEHRNKGLGKLLLTFCKHEAKKWQADKIYVCAGSAEETIAFYFAVGCKEAEEINNHLYESDPRDYQMELSL